jgi:hypothetical protein
MNANSMHKAAQTSDLRLEIARKAAQLIADEGLSYHAAKQKAAQLLARGTVQRNVLPDNTEIDTALAEHLAWFDPDHAERLLAMREVALALMGDLDTFNPRVTGAAWKGLATEFAPIHLQLFADNAKEVHYFLLNQAVDFESVEPPGDAAGQEAFAFEHEGFEVLLTLHAPHELRQHAALRGSAAALQALVDQQGLSHQGGQP